MSDAGEKPFEATPHRIARAKREGDVARAQEFGANAAFLGAIAGALAASAPLGAAARAAIAQAARGAMPIGGCAWIVAWALVPLAGGAAAAAGVGIVQSGGLRFVAPVPKFARLSPSEGAKRMCSRESAMHALRALLAFAAAVPFAASALREVLGGAFGAVGTRALAAVAWNGAVRVTLGAAAIGLIFAVAEYGAARRAWLRKLRMSFEEFKREVKERDGDPHVRGRRKALYRSLLRGSLERVKDAAFVVVNPTHVAVALDYRPPAVPVPTVLVRAADETALRVRALASEHGVPIVENVALARALFRDAEIDRPIPFDHYVAVAEIVAALARSGALEARG